MALSGEAARLSDTLASSNIAASASSSSSVSPALTRDHASTATSGVDPRGRARRACVEFGRGHQALRRRAQQVPELSSCRQRRRRGPAVLCSRQLRALEPRRAFGGGARLFVALARRRLGRRRRRFYWFLLLLTLARARSLGRRRWWRWLALRSCGGGEREAAAARAGRRRRRRRLTGGGGVQRRWRLAERAAFSRFCRWRRATFFHARAGTGRRR